MNTSNKLPILKVNFGLPLQRYQFDFYVTKEERLPIVSEFILKLIFTCNKIKQIDIQTFFGLTEDETNQLIKYLFEKYYVIYEGDYLMLSEFMANKFYENSKDFPSLTKVEWRRENINFDLLSFTKIDRWLDVNMTSDFIPINPEEVIRSKSEQYVKDSFKAQFSEMIGKVDRKHVQKINLYSIDSIDYKAECFLPIPVTFYLNYETGDVEREYNQEILTNSKLINSLNSAITTYLESKQRSNGNSTFIKFVDYFKLDIFKRFILGNQFNHNLFISESYLSNPNQSSNNIYIVGSPYLNNLTTNQDVLQSYYIELIEKLLIENNSSFVWALPEIDTWGKSHIYQDFIYKVKNQLKPSDKLSIMANIFNKREANRINSLFLKSKEQQVEITDVTIKDRSFSLGANIEILLSKNFVLILYYYKIGNNPEFPIGFCSTDPFQIERAGKYLSGNYSEKNTNNLLVDKIPLLNDIVAVENTKTINHSNKIEVISRRREMAISPCSGEKTVDVIRVVRKKLIK
jgi:hypothetical protein